MYSCVCPTVEGFIQRVAVSYVSRGYVFYVVGRVPDEKDPERVDAKLIARYGVDISKWSRARRKRAGAANVHYVRHGRTFVLLATHGEHEFFSAEVKGVRDIRRVPLKAFGYAVSYPRGGVQVRIEREEFKRVRAHLLELALHRGAELLKAEFAKLPFEPYAGVHRQLVQVLRGVNRSRRLRGFEQVSPDSLRTRRRIAGPLDT